MKLKYSAALCAFTAILICVYILMPGNADWLCIETPSYAVSGINFNVKVELKNPEPGLILGVDLHRMNNKKKSLGCLSVCRSSEVINNKTVYEFSIPVPHNKDAFYIFPVVILSRDGSWSGRVKAAESEPIPIRLSEQIPTRIILEQRKTRDIGEKTPQFIPESDTLRFITAALWGALAMMLLIKRNLHLSTVLALAAAVSAVWEGLSGSSVIAVYLRGIALHTGAYSLRRNPQQFFSIIIILSCTAVIIYLFYAIHKSHLKVLLICLISFWSISLLRILSLHEIDRLLTLTIAGIQTGQLLRLAAALLSAIVFLHIIINAREKY